MKKQIKNTLEGSFLDIALGLLLIVAIGTLVKSCSSCNQSAKNDLTIEDLHQLQEIKDYHKSQGRDIKVFEYGNQEFIR